MKNSDIEALLKKHKINGWSVSNGQTYVSDGITYIEVYSEADYIDWGSQTPVRVNYVYIPNHKIGVDVRIHDFEMLNYDIKDSKKTKLDYNNLDVIKKLISEKFIKELHLLLAEKEVV